MISFTVPGVPIAQPRQRHRVVQANGRTFATNFTPRNAPVQTFKASVQHAASEAHKGPPLEGPLTVNLLFVFPRPASMRWKTRPMEREWHDRKPDCENVVKAVLDALTGILFYDDRQVAALTAMKVIANGMEGAHTVVKLAVITERAKQV